MIQEDETGNCGRSETREKQDRTECGEAIATDTRGLVVWVCMHVFVSLF